MRKSSAPEFRSRSFVGVRNKRNVWRYRDGEEHPVTVRYKTVA